MKLALFSETYLPRINGVATHGKTLKEGLETPGHRVLVVTADPGAIGHRLEAAGLRCLAAELRELYGGPFPREGVCAVSGETSVLPAVICAEGLAVPSHSAGLARYRL